MSLRSLLNVAYTHATAGFTRDQRAEFDRLTSEPQRLPPARQEPAAPTRPMPQDRPGRKIVRTLPNMRR